MKKDLILPTDSAELRRLAESEVKQAAIRPNPTLSDMTDALRSVHELQVHQVELELQNRVLQDLRRELEQNLERYTNLYDFAPVGYATLASDSTIREINLAGAALLGRERARLMNQRLELMVSTATRPIFTVFLEQALIGMTPASCEVILLPKDAPARYVQLEGVGQAFDDDRQCRIALLDITERQRADEALRQAEHYARSLIEACLDPMITIHADGKIMDVNQAAEQMTGIPHEELIGKEFADCFIDPERARRGYQRVLSQGLVKDYLLTIQHVDSSQLIDVSFNASLYCDAAGKPLGVLAVARDITQRQLIEDALRTSLNQVERYHDQMIVLNRMNNLLLTCESRAEAYEMIISSAKILFAGGSGALAMRDDEAGLDLHVVATWGHPDNLRKVFAPQDCWALRSGELYEVVQPAGRVPCRHFNTPPTTPYWCVPLAVRGQALGLLHVQVGTDLAGASFQDWADLILKVSGSVKLALYNLQLQETLREQSIHDRLTGLFNRLYLDEQLPRELQRCQRAREPLVVAMLDLDHFKVFNDTYGHEAGDAILRAAGGLLLRSVRVGDHACRYGGEEMTLVLPNAALDVAWTRLDHLRQAMAQLEVIYQSQQLPTITVSIGASATLPSEKDAMAVLSRADMALYQAKKQGRNQVVVDGNGILIPDSGANR
ncbi:MAG: putative Diguanylate cyclase [Pseudomonadota bacterium]|nr:putative Diguanylate cyclase [Pseudomonadota bacterium]